jgi:hypothetical protein
MMKDPGQVFIVKNYRYAYIPFLMSITLYVHTLRLDNRWLAFVEYQTLEFDKNSSFLFWLDLVLPSLIALTNYQSGYNRGRTRQNCLSAYSFPDMLCTSLRRPAWTWYWSAATRLSTQTHCTCHTGKYLATGEIAGIRLRSELSFLFPTPRQTSSQIDLANFSYGNPANCEFITTLKP